ncbi:MAG TPA: prolipoprotein diacylglyceryl transferase family protein [Chitinophagaceae bacterium]|nr:prolipoprotein diacylglyceryl transferase family protein [Chitinophagaceae bacterium]
MYPNLYYAFKDLFGIEWRALRFVNSFGFFVAIAFILAAVLLTMELRRKSKQGLLFPTEMQVTVGKPASPGELLLNFILGFLLGYKIIGLFIMDDHATADPQEFIFSGIGSWPAGIGLGLLFAGLKWYDKNKQKLAKPENRIVRIWPHDRVGEMTILALIFGLLGAKLFDIFENWSDFLKRPNDYIFSAEGLTFYGGLICAALAIWLYAKRHKIGFWHLNDAAAPALMLAYAVGRIGCQVAGDGDWGIVNTKPKPFSWLPDWMWGYTYPHNVARQGDPIPGCTDRFCFELSQPVYPTPFYETIMGLVLFVILWSLRKKLKIPGTLFALYLMVNGLERFFIEKIRVNTRLNLFGFQPTQAEVISTLLFFTGLFLWIFLYQKSKQTGAVKSN